MHIKNINEWKNANLPSHLKEELNRLNDEQLKEAFYKDLDFGTGGLRGIMGVGTNRINELIIKKSTQGFANYLNNKFKNPSVAISYDNRINSKEFAYSAAKVLAANNITVYITPNLRPTPYLSYLIRHFNASGGIMITASHNPKEYNGYKVYEPHGGQLNLENSEAVINEISKITNIFNINEVDNELINWVNLDEIDELYLNEVKKIKLNDYKEHASIVYSPLHGTGSTLMPKLFKNLNYTFNAFKPHMINDGNFPNTKSTNPEEAKAYIDPINYAKKINADIVVLTDPDADRIGVAIKHGDTYEMINGNQIASLTLAYLLDHTKDIKNGYIFMSNVTSTLIETLGLKHNLKVIKTLPGFKFIAEEIAKLKDNETYVFGCEESNGNIIKPFVRDKDAIQATLMLAEMASFAKENKITLIDYLNDIYKRFGYYIEDTLSFEFKGLSGVETMTNLMNYFRNNKIILNNNKLVVMQDILNKKIYNFNDNSEAISHFAPQNILRFEYLDESWIMARPSGTEPKLKIYFSVKGTSLNNAETKLNELKTYVTNIINNFK